MKLEDQVCSLELAKKLKGLGVKQESLWYWDEHWEEPGIFHENETTIFQGHPDSVYSAFTVAELLIHLPAKIGMDSLQIYQDPEWPGDWCVIYGLFGSTPEGAFKPEHLKGGDNLTNAVAEMLIYLIQKGIINVKDMF